jgi:nicrotizing toxin Mtb-like protein
LWDNGSGRRVEVHVIRRLGAVLGAVVVAVALVAAPANAAPRSLTECSASYYHDDARLGPEKLPVAGSVGLQLMGYHRTGYLPEQRFLDKFYDSGSGSWRYPPLNGYVIGANGRPIEYQTTLFPGQRIDRYGSEYGGFLAPLGLPYALRSIPPSSLDSVPAALCNYHIYAVTRPFAVDAGPIAPWFAQPGGGLQYQLDGSLVAGSPAQLNVMWLLDNGYLSRLR